MLGNGEDNQYVRGHDGDFVDFYSTGFGEPSGDMDQSDGGSATVARVEGGNENSCGQMDKTIQEMVDKFAGYLASKNWKDGGYYISDVYASGSSEAAAALADRLVQRLELFRRGFAAVSVHNDHVHTIHSCAYSNRQCRCSFKRFPEAQKQLRRSIRKYRSVETLQLRDWKNIVQYFCTKQRRVKVFKVFGTNERIPCEITDLSDHCLSSQNVGGSVPSVEDSYDTCDNDDQLDGPSLPANVATVRVRNPRYKIVPGGEGGLRGFTGVIFNIIKNIAVCPLSNVVYCREYLENTKVAANRLDDRDVKNALDMFCSVVNQWKNDDFKYYYKDPKTVKLWSARNMYLFDTYYLDETESRDVVNKLLNLQCGLLGKLEFCHTLTTILDMSKPKLNSLLIQSPPSGGKNFFFNAIRDYYLNSGEMCNPNRYNNFAYQDCHNRRIIMWNEPNYEPSEIENLKKLLGGDNFSINIKCKPQGNVKRTPVIITCNECPNFCYDPAFADRLKVYQWQSAPFLKDYNKYPRPDIVMDEVQTNSSKYRH